MEIVGRRRRQISLVALVSAACAADGDVAEGAASGPVALAGFAEVARLREAVVVVVAEFGVGGIAAGAVERVGNIWLIGHCFIWCGANFLIIQWGGFRVNVNYTIRIFLDKSYKTKDGVVFVSVIIETMRERRREPFD